MVLSMSDAAWSSWKIALHLFTFWLPHTGKNFFLLSLTFHLGERGKGEKKYLTLRFLAFFSILKCHGSRASP